MEGTNLSVWGVRGWSNNHGRYEILAYVAETKADAYATCTSLHPDLDVESVYKIADY